MSVSETRAELRLLRLAIPLLALTFGACATGEGSGRVSGGEAGQETEGVPLDEFGQPLPEPDLLPPESGRESGRRLLQLEHALDAWFHATESQEYSRKESLELLLHDYGNQHFDAILGDLRGGNARRARVAAAALGFSDRAEAVRPLERALSSAEPQVVEHALLSLYQLGLRRSQASREKGPGIPGTDPSLLAPFLSNPRPAIRNNAALALRPNVGGAPTAADVLLALISACADTDDRVRVHAIAALGATGDPEAIPHLVKALSDPRPLGRMRAALGLGQSGNRDVAPYLIEVLTRENEVPEVKSLAVRALGAVLDTELDSTDPEAWRPLLKKP